MYVCMLCTVCTHVMYVCMHVMYVCMHVCMYFCFLLYVRMFCMYRVRVRVRFSSLHQDLSIFTVYVMYVMYVCNVCMYVCNEMFS